MTTNLADALTALSDRMTTSARTQKSALYFDYQGASQFDTEDVARIVDCSELMLQEGLEHAAHGQGTVFLTVHCWPFSVDHCRVLVQVAYTSTAGRQDFQRLSAMSGRWSEDTSDQSDTPCPPQIILACTPGNGRYLRREAPGSGAVLELEMTLHEQPPLDQADEALPDLATVSAWLIGGVAQTEAVLASRLQRDGWLVRMFMDLDDALQFQQKHGRGGTPALVVAAEQAGLLLPSLCAAKQTWAADCHVILGVQSGSAYADRITQVIDGIEIRKLPFSPADLLDLKAQASKVEGARSRDSNFASLEGAAPRRPRILVVDDGPVNRIIAEEMLRVLGYDSDMAEDGREAVEYIERYRPAAVLMDVDMPVMDGIEATERIRRYEQHDPEGRSPVRIIATTARADEQTYRECMRAGMSAFAPKPLMLTGLASALAAAA